MAGQSDGAGLVASLARPGGNVTGLSLQQTDAAGKRLELLREVVPGLRHLAILANVSAPGSVLEMGEVQAAARTLGLETTTLEIRRAEDIVPSFETLKDRAEALYVCTDPLVITNRARIHTLAIGARLPTIYNSREYVETGGLMSYGPNWPDRWRRAAEMVDKILRGEPGRHCYRRRSCHSGPDEVDSFDSDRSRVNHRSDCVWRGGKSRAARPQRDWIFAYRVLDLRKDAGDIEEACSGHLSRRHDV